MVLEACVVAAVKIIRKAHWKNHKPGSGVLDRGHTPYGQGLDGV